MADSLCPGCTPAPTMVSFREQGYKGGTALASVPGCPLTANQNLVSDRRLPERRPHEKTLLRSFLTSPVFNSLLSAWAVQTTWPLASVLWPSGPSPDCNPGFTLCAVPGSIPVRAPMTSGSTRHYRPLESAMDRLRWSEAERGRIPCSTSSMATNLGHCSLTLGRLNF